MFRRVENSLPADASYPADLKELGYFINEAGQIRMIQYPDKEFIYRFSNVERDNEVRREAMQTCQRQEVADRLSALGIDMLYLPTLTTTKPDGPHIPILSPPADILKTRKRVIVLINDPSQDLGILAYRQLQRELGLNGGSIVNFTKEIIKRSTEAKDGFDIFKDGAGIEDRDKETPGLIVMNTGQLLYSHESNKAMSLRSWLAQPRESICHDAIQIHDIENRVDGHRNAEEHIRTVFDTVIKNPDFVAPDAEIYVIAIEDGVEHILNILGRDHKYGSRITAMAVIQSSVASFSITNSNLRAFLYQRTRHWMFSDASVDPRECTEMPHSAPAGYFGHEAKGSTQPSSAPPYTPGDTINWLETVSPSGPISTISDLLERLAVTVTPHMPDLTASIHNHDVICPTFAGGENAIGECVFSSTAVQQAILDFFEEVARNPSEYRNPEFKIGAPEPTPENPLTLTALDEPQASTFQPLLPPEMSLEQQEVDHVRKELEKMKASLQAIPEDKPELEAGRLGLETRIGRQEQHLEELLKEALATGGLRAGEAQELRENWAPPRKGPKIPFAGAMVDSELVKSAGLFDTAEEKLRQLDSGNEGN